LGVFAFYFVVCSKNFRTCCRSRIKSPNFKYFQKLLETFFIFWLQMKLYLAVKCSNWIHL